MNETLKIFDGITFITIFVLRTLVFGYILVEDYFPLSLKYQNSLYIPNNRLEGSVIMRTFTITCFVLMPSSNDVVLHSLIKTLS